ncbi:11135_t:CDS:2 [Ambispora gerdemannii]|uniref:11135_t:CDS:1 n=1 Tax=Ambispora gerdemannii TaxID=144530 RepID=A0A9N9D1L3_9GLOM|nr:11135_t:CDS:2 [Ambispora gerdemannii]
MHTLDLANFPVTDTLKMLASLLEKITQANDQLKSHNINSSSGSNHSNNNEQGSSSSTAVTPSTSPSFTRFHARSVPSIDIYSYLARILKYCPTTNECFLSLLVYFDRMSKNALATTGKPFSIDSFNIHRLIISGIMVSSKFFSDVFFTNSRYAKLELEFLVLNEFRLAINIEELQRYGNQLLKHWVQEEEMKQGGPLYENSLRFSTANSIATINGVTRWDSQHAFEKNTLNKRSRRITSTDDTNTKNQYFSRGHRRDDSISSTKSLNINNSASYPVTSSPQPFSSNQQQGSNTPPVRINSYSGTSPNSSSSIITNNSQQQQSSSSTSSSASNPIINGSPMRGPFPPGVINNHHIHKPYPHHPHHQSQHQRSYSVGSSTIKRASSSNSLLNIHRSRSRDFSEDLQQFHQRHSSPKVMVNPEDHAYRTAAAPFPSGPSPNINGSSSSAPSSSSLAIPSSKYNGNGMTSNGNSLSTTSSTRVTFNPAATMAAAAHAALSYARRASLALPPLPRHPLTGFHNNSMPSPISPVPPPSNESMGPGIMRRGSVPTWSSNNISGGGGTSLHSDVRNISQNGIGVTNGSTTIPIPMNSSTINGNGRVHMHGVNGISNSSTMTPGSAPDLVRRSSWVVLPTTHTHSVPYQSASSESCNSSASSGSESSDSLTDRASGMNSNGINVTSTKSNKDATATTNNGSNNTKSNETHDD